MRRAVVAGAGIAGLAAAAAMAPHCDEVVVVERDDLTDGAGRRRGLAQGEQLHNLLGRGQAELRALFPGVLDGLAARGIGPARVALDTHVHEMGGVMPRRDLGLSLVGVDRLAVEVVARERLVEQHPSVRIRDRSDVLGPQVGPCGVEGALVRDADGEVWSEEADVVVDASGAGARGVGWLAALGRPIPPPTVARPDQWYVSVRVRDIAAGARFAMAFPPPGSTRGALLSPVGSDEWYLSVNGRSTDPVPTSFPEVVDHARSLADPHIAERIAEARPVGPPSRFRRITATWNRYDRLEEPIPGLLAIGDAVAALNPLFGQGMSVALWEAGVLGAAVAEWDADPSAPDVVTRRAHREVAAIVGQVWDLGAAIEGGVLGEACEPDQVARRAAAFVAAVHADADLHRRYVEVWHLLRTADDLQAPAPAVH